METVMKANVFFFVSTIGFVLLTVLGIFALYYLVRFLRTIDRITKQLEVNIHAASDEARFLIEDIRESMIFRLLFGRSRKRHTRKKEE